MNVGRWSGAENIVLSFQTSFNKQFDIHKFWIILEDGRFLIDDELYYGNSSYNVVYSVDYNTFPEGVLEDGEILNITYRISDTGIVTLSELRILEDSEVTWIPAQQIAYDAAQHKVSTISWWNENQ